MEMGDEVSQRQIVAFFVVVMSIPLLSVVGIIPTNMVTGIVTTILVMVTFVYAIQTQRMVDEIAEERELMEKSLMHQLKPSVIDLIEEEIDPSIKSLREEVQRIARGYHSVGKLLDEKGHSPSESVIPDIERVTPWLRIHMGDYREAYADYVNTAYSQRRNLQALLEAGEVRNSPTLKKVIQDFGYSQSVSSYAKEHAHSISLALVLTTDAAREIHDSEDIYAIYRNADSIRWELLEEERIIEFHEKQADAQNAGVALLNEFEAAREAFKDEYQIFESEIETELDPHFHLEE